MYKKVIWTLFVIVMGQATMFGQNKTEKFKVYGNCEMCEKRIENTAKRVKGVETADWDKETKMLVVTFNESKTELIKIHEAMAKVGHDTDLKRADDKKYNRLHTCCKYERAVYPEGQDPEMKKE